MITFETEERTDKAPTFGDVEINQLFANSEGFLCQKVDSQSFTFIASPDGTPLANYSESATPSEIISRILPRVTKINF